MKRREWIGRSGCLEPAWNKHREQGDEELRTSPFLENTGDWKKKDHAYKESEFHAEIRRKAEVGKLVVSCYFRFLHDQVSRTGLGKNFGPSWTKF